MTYSDTSPSRICLYIGLVSLLCLSGCGGISSRAGGYFDNDGPPSAFIFGSPNTGDAELKVEKTHVPTTRPYTVMGKRYFPMSGDKPFTQTGIASWYGKQFHGRKTAIGERYDMFSMTAAHPTMELPSYARVTNLNNGRSVIVRVNDRGPFLGGRVIDMSYAAAVKLGYQKIGTTRVRIDRITRREIAAGYTTSSSTNPAEQAAEPVVMASVKPTEQELQSEIEKIVALSQASAPDGDTTKQESMDNILRQQELDHRIPEENPVESANADDSRETPTTAPRPVDGVVALAVAANDSETSVSPESSAGVPKFVTESASSQSKAVSANIKCWSSQIGAYSSETSAREVAAHAEMMFSEHRISFPVQVQQDGKLFRVLVGDFASRQDAFLHVTNIDNLLGVKSFLKEHPK